MAMYCIRQEAQFIKVWGKEFTLSCCQEDCSEVTAGKDESFWIKSTIYVLF